MALCVAGIMTCPVIGIEPSASVGDAVKLMLGSRVSGLPVVEGKKGLVGIITEGDFLRRAELGTGRKQSRWLEFFASAGSLASEYMHSHGRNVYEVMSTDLVTISPDATLDELVTLMASRRVKLVPVVKGGNLLGVVARADLMRALIKSLPGTQLASADDEQMRQQIIAELAKQHWSAMIRVDVHCGVVDLTGIIFDEHARDAARVAAENVTGVSSVVDQLAWVEPISGVYIAAAPFTDV